MTSDNADTEKVSRWYAFFRDRRGDHAWCKFVGKIDTNMISPVVGEYHELHASVTFHYSSKKTCHSQELSILLSLQFPSFAYECVVGGAFARAP